MMIATHSPVFKRLRKERIATAEERLARLQKIHNLTFLRYSDYRALSTDSHGYGKEWGYVTRADGDVSYGDLKEEDCPDSAETYLRALSTDDTDSGEVYFYVPCASGSDYSGSTVEKCNYNVFTETYGKDCEWVFSAHGGYNTYAAVVGLTGLLTCDEDTADEVLNVLAGLEDYPLIDEEALSTLESEESDSAWESWGAHDFGRAVEKKFADVADLELPSGDDLRTFFEEKREAANLYWYNEGYGNDMYVDIDGVAAGVEFADVEDFAVRYTVSWIDVGAESEDYFLESEAIALVATLRATGHIGASYTVNPPVKK